MSYLRDDTMKTSVIVDEETHGDYLEYLESRGMTFSGRIRKLERDELGECKKA